MTDPTGSPGSTDVFDNLAQLLLGQSQASADQAAKLDKIARWLSALFNEQKATKVAAQIAEKAATVQAVIAVRQAVVDTAEKLATVLELSEEAVVGACRDIPGTNLLTEEIFVEAAKLGYMFGQATKKRRKKETQ